MNKLERLKKWAYENIGKMDDADILKIVENQKQIWSEQPRQAIKKRKIEHVSVAIKSALLKEKQSQSGAEQIVANALSEERIQHTQQYPIGVYEKTDGKMGARYYLDFLVEDYLNVEIDGEVWHNKDRDDFRDRHMKKLGYQVMRFPASLVYFDVESIIEDIKKELSRN